MPITPRISPFLWFDYQAEEAVAFYTGIFPNSRITRVARYGEAGFEHHGRPAGSVMTIGFELDGQEFTALNGGPVFHFTEAVSFSINCETQQEIDYYWTRLTEGGEPAAQQCGWLRDKFGVSWQVVPRALIDLLGDPSDPRSQRAMSALMEMKKLDIARLRQAYEG